MEFVLGSIGAFLLFLVGLPLVGLAIGSFMRVLLPYAIGPVVAVLMVNLLGFEYAWWAKPVQIILSLIWICSILHVRQRLGKIKGGVCWYEGHFFGAANIVTFAWPLKRKRHAVLELQPDM